MKRYAIFYGCKIPYFLEHYATSTQAVLANLDIELVDLPFTCCGYPTRNIHFPAFVLSAARNLSLAEKHHLSILTPCKCCFGSLKHADRFLHENQSLRNEINDILAKEDLQWEGNLDIKHLLSVIHSDVGIPKLKDKIKHSFKNVKIAAHYGCHALRPGNVTQFDNPLAPTIFEELIQVTGASCVDWSMRLQCCGHPILDKNKPLSLDLMQKKVNDAHFAGADYLCVACTYCQIQFDAIQSSEKLQNVKQMTKPSLLYSQLLGLSLGLSESDLGLSQNHLTGKSLQ